MVLGLETGLGVRALTMFQAGAASSIPSAGDAMRDWQRRLSVAPDASRDAKEERGAAADGEAPQEDGGQVHGGQHEFVPEGKAPLPGMSPMPSVFSPPGRPTGFGMSHVTKLA